MLTICSMLSRTYYVHFNAGIIRTPLITGKVTVVLLLTVSLIMDQMRALQTTGLIVTYMYLGTMQSDHTVMGKIAQAQYDLVLSTPESFFDKLGQPKPVFRSLAVQCKLGLVAVDEAHLVRTWRTSRYIL